MLVGAALDLDVLIDDDAWTAALPDPAAWCRRAASAAHVRAATLRGVGAGTFEACLLLADDALLHRLNREFRGRDEPTDVLSFPSVAADVLAGAEALRAAGGNGPPVLGDVAIAYGVAAAEAEREGKALADHLSHLVIHAILHLWGWDHERPADAAVMEALEVEVLGALGIADPYTASNRR